MQTIFVMGVYIMYQARVEIRRLSGVRFIMLALSYRRSIVHVDQIRVGAALVLLGLAHDRNINSILAKMDIQVL